MSVKDDLLDEKDSIFDENDSEEIEPAEKFSFRQNELEGNNPSWDCGAC